MSYNTRYQIGDHLHVSGFGSATFSVEVTIIGIADQTLASQYFDDPLLLLFNNDPNENYLSLIEDSTLYWYVCKLDEDYTSVYANADGILILTDALIIHDNTYKIEDTANINLSITYSTYTSGYTSKEALIEDISNFLSEKKVDYTLTENYSDEELLNQTIQAYSVIVNKLGELEDCVDIIEDLKSINSSEISTTYNNLISLLQNQIDILLQKIESLS